MVRFGDLEVSPRLSFRVRGELVGDRTLTGAALATPITHRFRVGTTLRAFEVIAAVFEVQDVRLWGAELPLPELPQDPTLYGTVPNSLDIHQAWLGLKSETLELRLGRQEVSIANERLVGTVDFVQRGRVFDGIRVMHETEAVKLSALGAVLSDADAGATSLGDRILLVLSSELPFSSMVRFAPAVVYDNHLEGLRHRFTGGGRVDGAVGAFQYDVDAYAQLTSIDAATSVSWLAGARASYSFDTFLHPKVGGLVDIVSGTGSGVVEGGVGAFDTLFATNHRFYGFQDLFLNLPAHTKGRGLIDIAPVLWSHEGPVSVTAFGHIFLPYAQTGVADTGFYGIEPDVVMAWKILPWLVAGGGASIFFPVGDGLGRGNTPAAWGYAQLGLTL